MTSLAARDLNVTPLVVEESANNFVMSCSAKLLPGINKADLQLILLLFSALVSISLAGVF